MDMAGHQADVTGLRLLIAPPSIHYEVTFKRDVPAWLQHQHGRGLPETYRVRAKGGSWIFRGLPYAWGEVDGHSLAYFWTEPARSKNSTGDVLGLSPVVASFAALVQAHLEHTVPEKGPWGHYTRPQIVSRIKDKAQMLEQWAEENWHPESPREEAVKLACRALILMDTEGWLGAEGSTYGTL